MPATPQAPRPPPSAADLMRQAVEKQRAAAATQREATRKQAEMAGVWFPDWSGVTNRRSPRRASPWRRIWCSRSSKPPPKRRTFSPTFCARSSSGIWFSALRDLCRSGQLYKPLFAILCTDLDGRLNLQCARLRGPEAFPVVYNFPVGGSFAGGTLPAARGQGFGPAEIGLAACGATPQLLTGNGTYQGRYGQAGTLSSNVQPLSQNRWFEYATPNSASYALNFWTFSNVNNSGSYGSPIDPFRRRRRGAGDQAGRPLYTRIQSGATSYVGYGSGLAQLPYQLNLGANAAPARPAERHFGDEHRQSLRPRGVGAAAAAV